MDDMKEEEVHPSFGMIGFSRIQVGGAGMPLFGSDLTHSTVIEMKLHYGSRKRGLNHDWYHAGDKVASVYLSQNQFAEMITSMNMGDGVPCTINFTETKGHIEQPEFRSIIETHKQEFEDHVTKVREKSQSFIQDVEETLSGTGTVKKKDRERLLHSLQMIMQEIECNFPYMEKSFQENMEKVVTDAKGTIEAFYQHRVVEAGLEKLSHEQRMEQPRLVEPGKTDAED